LSHTFTYLFPSYEQTVNNERTGADVSTVDVVVSDAGDAANDPVARPRTMQPAAIVDRLGGIPVHSATTGVAFTRLLTRRYAAR